MEKTSIADIQKLENENAKLKKQLADIIGVNGHEALRMLRGITLRSENKFLRELFTSLGIIPSA